MDTRILEVATLSDTAIQKLLSDMTAKARILSDALRLACSGDEEEAERRFLSIASKPPREIVHHARIASMHASQGRQPGGTDLAAGLFMAKAAAVAAQLEAERRSAR